MLSSAPNNTTSSRGFLTDFIVATSAFLFIYAYLIFRFGLFGDEVWDIARGTPSFYIAAGRWGVTLFRTLTSDIVTPVSYGLVSAICVGLSISLQIRHFKLHTQHSPTASKKIPRGLNYLYIAIHLGIIQLAYILTFSFHADAVCVGYLLSTIGYLVYQRGIKEKRITLLLASTACFALATSMYQTLILIPFLLFCLDILSSILHSENRRTRSGYIKHCLTFFSFILISFLLYTLSVSLTMPLASPKDIEACLNYQQSLITWGGAPAWVLALHAAKLMSIHLIGLAYTGEWFYASTIIPVILLLICIWRGERSTFEKFLAASCVLSLWVLPFLPILPIGRDMGARLFYAEPMTCAALWCLCLKSDAKLTLPIPSWLLYTLAAILIIKASYMVSDMAFRQKLMYEQTLRLSEEIKQRAWHTEVPDGVDVYTCPIVVVGKHSREWPEDRYQSAVIGFGGAFWQGLLYQYTCSANMKTTSQLPQEKLQEELRGMSTYPAKGSCRYVDGEILVKLSDSASAE